MQKTTRLEITRVCNACVLIEIGEHAILTDPYFINLQSVGIKESVAISPEDLPPLTAIVGCHAVIDHWQIKGLQGYRYCRDDVKVFVAMNSQARSARKFGFNNVEVLDWGEERQFAGELSIGAVQAQRMFFWRVNNYIIRCGDVSVFFGSEARDLEPLRQFKEEFGSVDVAILPPNGVHLFGGYQLVMTGKEAVEGAKLLGAKQLFIIHDAHPTIPGFIHIRSSGKEAKKAASKDGAVRVIQVETGERWSDKQH